MRHHSYSKRVVRAKIVLFFKEYESREEVATNPPGGVQEIFTEEVTFKCGSERRVGIFREENKMGVKVFQKGLAQRLHSYNVLGKHHCFGLTAMERYQTPESESESESGARP